MKITMFLVLTLALIFVLPGCAKRGMTQQAMTKPGATQTEFNIDKARCEYEVNLAMANHDVGIANVPAAVAYDYKKAALVDQCMNLKGWN